MEALENLKKYLRDLDYPNVNILGNNEIADVFGGTNRLNFLTWFVQKMDPSVTLPQNSEQSASLIADIIFANGFCTCSQKDIFVRGDNSLDASKQIPIIESMLSVLTTVQGNAPQSLVECFVEDVVHSDINLFPKYGPMEPRRLDERVKRVTEIEEQIAETEEEIRRLEADENLAGPYDTSRKDEDLKIVDVLSEASLKFHQELRTFSLDDEVKNNLLGFGDRGIVPKCNAEIQKVCDIVRSMSVIASFSDDKITAEVSDDNEIVAIVETLATLSDKLIK